MIMLSTNESPTDGVLSFATISLALKVPRIADARAQQFAVFLWSGVLLCMYSFLLSVFRMKTVATRSGCLRSEYSTILQFKSAIRRRHEEQSGVWEKAAFVASKHVRYL